VLVRITQLSNAALEQRSFAQGLHLELVAPDDGDRV
jgi:hypothetical protein